MTHRRIRNMCRMCIESIGDLASARARLRCPAGLRPEPTNMNPTRYIAAAAAVLFASALPAQLAKGSVAPAFEIQKAWNDGPTQFDELEGKLVILDFAQTW
jgi:hypothetical protein